MNNTVDPEKLKKAKIASSCFMGLGQILFLKQYLRGALYALVEVVMICCFIFGTKKVIPANNSEEKYMKGIPEFSEMVEYLQEKNYENLNDLVGKDSDRSKDIKEYFEKVAIEKLADFEYRVNIATIDAKMAEEAEESGDSDANEAEGPACGAKVEKVTEVSDADKNKKNALLGEAKDKKAETVKDLKAKYSEVDYDDIDSISDAVDEYQEAYNEIITEYEDYLGDKADAFLEESEAYVDDLNKIVTKYNEKAAKAMSNIAYKEFNASAEEFYDGFDLAAEEEKVAKEKENEISEAEKKYEDTKAEIEAREVFEVLQKSVEHIVVPATETADASSETASGSAEEVYTSLQKNEDLAKAEEDYKNKLVSIDREYSYDLKKKVLKDHEIENAFDKNFDNCFECQKAAKAGKRTVKHTDLFFGSPMVSSLTGLVSLGVDQPTNVMNYKDHSINMMIDGIFALIFIGLFVVLYAMNIQSTKTAAKKIIKNGRFPTMRESQDDMSQHSFATVGMAPSVIMIAVFSVIPLLFSALVAFTNYQSPDHIPPKNLVSWVGFENFVTMFSTGSGVAGGGQFFAAFANAAIWTFVWAIFATLTCFFVGFFYAVVLQDKRIKFPSIYRTVYILPYAIPTMLSLFIWANLLNGQMGPINHTLRLLGIIDAQGDTPVMFSWLSNPWVAKCTLIFVNIWIGFPYSMILTTSSMTAISASLYEAATIDGANKWHQFKSITFPLVMFQLKPILIMQFAGNINNFGAVFFLTGGGPNLPQTGLTTSTSCGATDLLISWIYKLTMNTPMRYNLASVLSLLVFAVLVPFALYSFTRTKSFKEGEV